MKKKRKKKGKDEEGGRKRPEGEKGQGNYLHKVILTERLFPKT